MRRIADLTLAQFTALFPPIAGGAFELYRWTFPGIAASAINAGDAVLQTASAAERQFVSAATANQEPFGIALATAAQAGATPPFTAAVPVVDLGNTIKVTAIASLGVGADVGVASTNGGLGPVAAASGTDIWRVGKAVGPASAGEVFGLYVSPRKLSSVVR
jgi:hypothetical protein